MCISGIMEGRGSSRSGGVLYLKRDKKKNGRVYLSITESYRNAEGVQRNRVVRSLGYLDDLEREWGPGALERCEAIRDEMTAEARERNAPQTLTIHPSEKVDMREDNRKNIGVAVPLSYYNLLGVERAVRNACRGRRLGFDCNAAMRLLVADRLFDSGSKLSAWERRGKWFFEAKLSDDDVYRSLDVLAGARDSVIGAMNRSMAASGLREPGGNVFYDVTNYYFEVDDADGLRRKGVSKEHRPDPIVQMGLLQDRGGLPITYRLFPGNTADCLTMIPVLADMKRDFGLERVVAVADKGLNCSDNIAALYAKGDGFVFSQSIRGTRSPAELREWAVSEEGYAERGEGFKVKSRQGWKTVTLKAEDSDDGKSHKLRVPVKQVAFWSEKYARRAEHDRADAVAKARELAADPSRYDAATHYGAARYLDGLSVDKETGELLECARVVVFDEAKLEAERRLDGYYVIVTSETAMSDDDVIDTYRGLWRIEESFRITKSDLEARPVWVRTPAHIEAHFLVCYVALAIARIMQLVTGFRHSARAMLEDLAAVSCTSAGGSWWLFDHRTQLTDELFALIGRESPTRWMRTKDVKSLLNKSIEPVVEIPRETP